MYDVRFIFCVVVTCALRSSTETHDNLKLDQIFRTPRDFSKVNFDHLEILERNNFDPQINPDPENEALSSHSKLHPKSVANAQVMLRFGGDDIKGTNQIDKNIPAANPVVAKVGHPYPLQPSPHHHHPYHHLTNEIKTPYHPNQYLPPYGQHYAPMQYGQYFVPPYMPYQYPPNMYCPGCNYPYLPYGVPNAPGFLPNESFYSGHHFLDNSHQRNIANTINVNRPKILKTADLSNDVIPENNENVNPQDNRGPVCFPSSSGIIMHSRPHEIIRYTKENINQPYSAYDFLETGNPQEVSPEHDKTVLIEYDTHIGHSSSHEQSKLHHNLKIRPIHEKVEKDDLNYPHYHYILPKRKNKKEEKDIPAHTPHEHDHIQHIAKKHHKDLDSVKNESPIVITSTENESIHSKHADDDESHILCIPRMQNKKNKKTKKHSNSHPHSIKQESESVIAPAEKDSSLEIDHHNKHPPIDVISINGKEFKINKPIEVNNSPIKNDLPMHIGSVKKESVHKDLPCNTDLNDKDANIDICVPEHKDNIIEKLANKEESIHILSVDKDAPIDKSPNKEGSALVNPVNKETPIENTVFKDAAIYIKPVDKEVPIENTVYKDASISIKPVDKEKPITTSNDKDSAINILHVDKERPIKEDTPDEVPSCETEIPSCSVKTDDIIVLNPTPFNNLDFLHHGAATIKKEDPISIVNEDPSNTYPYIEDFEPESIKQEEPINIVSYEVNEDIKNDDPIIINPNNDIDYEPEIIKQEEPINIVSYEVNEDIKNDDPIIINPNNDINVLPDYEPETIKQEEPINIGSYEVNEDIKNEDPININPNNDIDVLPDYEPETIKQEEPINIGSYEVNEDIKNEDPININPNNDIDVVPDYEPETIKQEEPINIGSYEVYEGIKNEDPINIESIVVPETIKQEEPTNIVGYEVNEDIKSEEPVIIESIDDIAVLPGNEDYEPETIKQEEPINIAGYEVNEDIKSEEPVIIESIDNIAEFPGTEDSEPETIKQEEPINIVGYQVNEEPININPNDDIDDTIKREDPIVINNYEVNEDSVIPTDDIILLPDNDRSETVIIKEEEPTNIVGYEVNEDVNDRSLLDSVKKEEPIYINPINSIDVLPEDDNSDVIKQEDPTNILGYEVNEGIKNEEPATVVGCDTVLLDNEDSYSSTIKKEDPVNIVPYEVIEDIQLPNSIKNDEVIIINPADSDNSAADSIKQEDQVYINPTDNVGYEVNDIIGNIPLLDNTNEDPLSDNQYFVIENGCPKHDIVESVNEEFAPLKIIIKDPDSCTPVSEGDCTIPNKVHFIDVELSRPQKGCKEVEEWLNHSLVPYECSKCGKKLLVSYPITGNLDSHIIPITEIDDLDVATSNCPCCKLKGFCDCQNCQCHRKPTIPYGKRFDEDVDSLFKVHNDNSNWNPTFPFNIWDHLETTPPPTGFTHSFKKTSSLGFTRVGNQEPEITYNGFLSHSGGGSFSDPFQNIFYRQPNVINVVSKPYPCKLDQYEIPQMYHITSKYKIVPKQIQALKIPDLLPTETFTCCKLPYPNNNKIVCQRQYLAGNHPILIEN